MGTKSAVRSSKKNGDSDVMALTPETRRHYVEVAAYYIAERQGFVSANPMADWLAAETEIDRLLAAVDDAKNAAAAG